MGQVVILGSRLSRNTNTATVQNVQGINGVVNVTENGKQFYITDAMVLKGIKPVVKSQLVWADDNGNFGVSAEDFNLFTKGTKAEGKLVRFEDVPPYEVEGKQYTHVELLVMDGETESSVVSAFIKSQQRSKVGGA